MSTRESCTFDGSGSRVTVNVDVTRIVKYVCIAGVLIVGIIFGTRFCHKNICSAK
jgi:hypothetical protein